MLKIDIRDAVKTAANWRKSDEFQTFEEYVNEVVRLTSQLYSLMLGRPGKDYLSEEQIQQITNICHLEWDMGRGGMPVADPDVLANECADFVMHGPAVRPAARPDRHQLEESDEHHGMMGASASAPRAKKPEGLVDPVDSSIDNLMSQISEVSSNAHMLAESIGDQDPRYYMVVDIGDKLMELSRNIPQVDAPEILPTHQQ